MEICEANLEDPRTIAEITKLNLEFVAESGVTTNDGHGDRLKKLLMSHPTLFAFIARDSNGNAVGYALCQFTISSFAATTVANVHDLYVQPDSRGQGIARRLMDSFEASARTNRCGRLTLEVKHDNTQAQDLYKKLGFSDGSTDRDGDSTWFWVKNLD